MKLVESLNDLEEPVQPVVFSIGNFDGMHLGHQSILRHVKHMAEVEQLTSAILTFKNHPSSILEPNPAPLLTTFKHKIKLIEQAGIDLTIAIPFTREVSMQPAKTFLNEIFSRLPFRHLILGYDAKLGMDRLGDEPMLHAIANELHFMLEFLPLEMCGGLPISSSRIRKALMNQDLNDATFCLGRKFTITGNVLSGHGVGHKLGFPTANISLKDLCYPRPGVYCVTAETLGGRFPGVSYIGTAPTLRHDHIPLLETHLLTTNPPDLYNQWMEVTLEEFLRPDKTFSSVEDLIDQMKLDVKQAKEYFKL